ncbi:MAG: RIP metalloprotease RseP [Alphaproteobacteria bacterium]|nr:RIP metalloprotease RseP [Alphaproteobacteria bacterium]
MAILINILAFVVIFSIVVFVHELGHFLIARWNGVRVEVFAIGFGPELFGYSSSTGTRWKVCAIPLGGYVKMYGDADATSARPKAKLSDEEKKNWSLSIFSKSAGQRAIIALGGPIGNFIFAVLVFFALFEIYGKPTPLPILGSITTDSAAEKAGLKIGDHVLEFNGIPLDSFEQLSQQIKLNPAKDIKLKLKRNNEEIEIIATPETHETKDLAGTILKTGILGVRPGAEQKWTKLGPIDAVTESVKQTWFAATGTIEALGQMITGKRSADELGGPIRIFQMTGQAAQVGIASLISFMAMLSIGLGVINLFPIPALDGGQVLFCAVEGIRGKPLNEKAQNYVTIFGVLIVLALMIFSFWNDLKHIKAFEWVSSLF